MKAIWLSALHKDETAIRKLMAQCKRYGFEAAGHFWENDNAKMAWTAVRDELKKANTDMWALWGDREDFKNPDIRYGLSMIAICMRAIRGSGYPIVILQNGGELLTAEDLPTPLKGASIFPVDQAGVFAKLVAKLHAPLVNLPIAYHIDVVGNLHIGQWFEIRPADGIWPGVIFGVDEGDIRFQAVGPIGTLPDKTTLEYAMRGLTVELAGVTYTAWAVRNQIDHRRSYYIKVDGTPGVILFGAFSEEAQTDLYVVRLK